VQGLDRVSFKSVDTMESFFIRRFKLGFKTPVLNAVLYLKNE